MTVAEVKLVDGKYVGYYRGNAITTQNSLEKALKKLEAYIRSQK